MTARGSADATADVNMAEAMTASDDATLRRCMPISTSSTPDGFRRPICLALQAAIRQTRGCLVPRKHIETAPITGHSIHGERLVCDRVHMLKYVTRVACTAAQINLTPQDGAARSAGCRHS